MSNHTTTADSGKSDVSARDYIFSGTPEQFEALIGYAKQSVLAPRGLERISLWVSGENAVFSFTTMERLDGCTMVKAQIFTGDWARFEPVLTDLQALAARAGYTLLPFDSETGDQKRTEPRGASAGTYEKVQEAHRLRKQGKQWREVKKSCSHETYTRWCFEVTGEDPV